MNIIQNLTSKNILAFIGDGYKSHLTQKRSPYDLIICNILSGQLMQLSSELVKNLQPRKNGGGFVILSGILKKQANRVIATHTKHGLKLVDRVTIGQWQTLVLRN